MHEHERTLGPRFWVVRYEEFCREPHRVVERVAEEILRVPIDRARLRAALPALEATNRITVPEGEFREIEATLARLSSRSTVEAVAL